MQIIEKEIPERAPNLMRETFSNPARTLNVVAMVRSVEKNCDYAAMLKILDEKCRKCTPITPLECISRCKTWKLKNELRVLHKNVQNPDFARDLMNVLKNDTRLQILIAISKSRYSVHELQQELRMAGYSHSQDNIVKVYLQPLLEAGLAVEDQELYHTTTFGGRLTEMIEGSANLVNSLPANSECYEETVLKALLSGPKTFEDINGLLPENVVSRILRRLKKVNLAETPRDRDYIFFFRTKRDPAKETFSSTESKVYYDIPDGGISAPKLAEKAELAQRTIYKCLRALKGKKLVFAKKMPKAYCLTAKGEKLALTLDKLGALVEETLSSSEQVFQANENVVPQISDLSGACAIQGCQGKPSLLAEEKAETMKRSQLEMYVDILEALANAGPLKLTQVMRNANVECNMLRDCIDFLTAQGLVEVRTVAKERKVYAITQLGVTVLKQFRDLKEVRPIIVETANNVKKRETYPF